METSLLVAVILCYLLTTVCPTEITFLTKQCYQIPALLLCQTKHCAMYLLSNSNNPQRVLDSW